MCGIIGYTGERNTKQVLIRALSRLEYRGYDSAGLAVISPEGLVAHKVSGKLKVLCESVQDKPLEGAVGIGHTRWATHGEPSARNAHPHTDCTHSIAVVHNGIIENYGGLRQTLTEKGHRFQSDTDTEVLAHLVEQYHLQEGYDLERAVRLTLRKIEGSYAFCVLSKKNPSSFVTARNGSPLIIGLGRGENFVASDARAILDYTRDVIFLDDYQMAVVSRNGVKVTSARGDGVPNKVTRIDWNAKDASKEGFDHYMAKEIEEQPQALERIIRTRLNGDLEASLFDTLPFGKTKLRRVERILIQACGTSWHAGLAGKFFLEGIAGLPTEVDVSSEFRYRHLIPQQRALVLSITQSGETIDTLVGLRRGKERGFKTLSICNVMGSTIARESDGVIYTHAGPEIGVASTKAYTAQLTILFLLSLYWGRVRGSVTPSRFKQLVREFKALPEKMQQILDRKDNICEVAKKYFEARDFLFLARGVNYPNAHEGALKIKEIAYIHATGHPAGEMKHGPIALIDEKMPVVAIVPQSSVYEKMVSNIQEVKARAGKVIAIATEGDQSIKALADDTLYIPETNEFLSPLLVALPLQYLAYFVATLRGTDVDQPRNLAKSVTVE